MSAETVWAGAAALLADVEGIKSVNLGEPSAAHDVPAIFGGYDRFERSTSGQVTGMRHFFGLRLVLLWHERPEAEAELLSFINRIPAAIDVDPTLRGAITKGLAKCAAGAAGFQRIGQTLYRICDFELDALEKGDYRGGI